MDGERNVNEEVCVVRPALTVEQRCEKYSYTPKTPLGISEVVRAKTQECCTCSSERLWSWCQARLPILQWLPKYPIKSALLADVIAGMTVAVMHIPQGMAYSLLANLPPITGLYMAFFPVLIYVFLGTSSHISMGTYAMGSLLMSKIVTELSTEPLDETLDLLQLPDGTTNGTITEGVSYTAQQVSAILGLVVGLWEVAFGLLNLGELLNVVLSDMLISGFTTSVGFHVLTSQIKYLLGIPVGSHYGPLKSIYVFIDIFSNLMLTKIAVLLISLVCIAMLVINNEILKPRLKKYTNLPIPMELIVVVLGTLASYFGDFHGNYDVKVVGEIPTGLPTPSIPPFGIMPDVLVTGLIIAVVGYTSSYSMAKIFGKKHGYTIDGTQEFYAQGTSNVFGSFFSCGPIAASLSRSLIQEAVGSMTLLTAFISCFFVLLILLFIGPLFETLPNCVLSSIIVVSLKGLFLQVNDLKTLWSLSRSDAFIWLATFIGSVILDIDYGLLVGVIASMLVLLFKSQKPTTACLGQIPNTDLYLDVSEYPQAVTLPGIRIFKFCGSLHFANTGFFREKFFSKTRLEWVLSNTSKKDLAATSAKDSGTSVNDAKAGSAKDSNTVGNEVPLMNSNAIPTQRSDTSSMKNSSESVNAAVEDNTKDPERMTASEDESLNPEKEPGETIQVNGPIQVAGARKRPGQEVTIASSAVISVQDVEWTILDLSGAGFVDVTGCRCLTQLHKDLQEAGITLCIAGATDQVMEMLERCGTVKSLGREHFFHSTHDAVTVIDINQTHL